jgi:hypothetical protein
MLNIVAILKTGETREISVLQEREREREREGGGGFLLRMTNVLRGRISPSYLGHSFYFPQRTIN